jgi:hypothetical protein
MSRARGKFDFCSLLGGCLLACVGPAAIVANPFPVAKGKNLKRLNPVPANTDRRLSFGVFVHGRPASETAHLDRNGIYQQYLEHR